MSKRIIFSLFLIVLLSSCAIVAMDNINNPIDYAVLNNAYDKLILNNVYDNLVLNNGFDNLVLNDDLNNALLNELNKGKSLLTNSFLSSHFTSNFKKEIDVFDFIPTIDSIDIYNDGENVSIDYFIINPAIDTDNLSDDIIDYTFEVMEDPKANITTLKEGINDICSDYGLNHVEANIDSVIGKDEIPVVFQTEGDSMYPTIKNGQKILVNKTHDIEVGDLVSANSSEYGPICKRVADIDGDSVYLVSDNKEVTYEYYDGYYLEYKGITTWVNINDIDGEIIKIFN